MDKVPKKHGRGNDMILGLDVGGTQTDAVLIENGAVVAESKTVNSGDLISTLRAALDKTLAGVSPRQIERMVFSTTQATNAIIMDRLDPAGMIVSAGPGMDPEWFRVGPSYHVVPGCMDHRGSEVMPLDKAAVLGAAATVRKAGIEVCGVVSKFSVRNPLHEIQAAKWMEEDFAYTALGHRFSGSLNFPRRVATTYLNAGLFRIHHQFVSSLVRTLRQLGLDQAPQYLMKPDGGTVRLARTYHFPAQTAQSGPAASVMGALALDAWPGTSLVLDVGGTTTDMALILDGVPLCVPQGITLGPYQTSIRSLLTRSIGIGGDSEVSVDKRGHLRVGPLRQGSPRAFGGPAPTPMDALVALGIANAGNKRAAMDAMAEVGQALGTDPLNTARIILDHVATTIAESARAFIHQINARPVYTIYEVIEGATVTPDAVVVLGGPALWLAPLLGRALGLPHRVPEHYGVANAVGAAAARVTVEITLQADTQRGTVVIPEAGIESPIPRDFSLGDCQELARQVLAQRAREEGADVENLSFTITEQENFNMIRGGMKTGRNIRLKLAVVPGLVSEWKAPGNPC
jgi:N-methylhydantoinase A/oxoprolinase/acetone carboxylase beta subunit